MRAGAPPARFQLFEIWQNVSIAPALDPLRMPELGVMAAAAHVDHRVDRGAAAERSAAPDREPALLESRFRLRLERPDIVPVTRDLGKRDRHGDEGMAVTPAGLEEENRDVRILAQPR